MPTRGRLASEALSPDVELAGFAALVVDDNATQRDVLTEYLSDWGMTVATADSGRPRSKRCARRVAAAPFAVALLDRSMPGMDGSS